MPPTLFYRRHEWTTDRVRVLLVQNTRSCAQTLFRYQKADVIREQGFATWDEAFEVIPRILQQNGCDHALLQRKPDRTYGYTLDGGIEQQISDAGRQDYPSWTISTYATVDRLRGELTGIAATWDEAIAMSLRAVPRLIAATAMPV